MWKGVADIKKAKRLSKEEIKKQLLDSVIIDENPEFDDLNKEAEEIQDPQKEAEIIKRYEDIIKTKKKGIINVAFLQGQIFKRFFQCWAFLSFKTKPVMQVFITDIQAKT